MKEKRTTFTPVVEGLAQKIEAGETLPVENIKVGRKAKVVILQASGDGNARPEVLEEAMRQANGRPVIVTTEAGAYVNLTSYEPGRLALTRGAVPSGGLIPVSAEIRAEYLASRMHEIREYAEKHAPNGVDRQAFVRRLFATLYLSGAKFKRKGTKEEHSKALGIPILGNELLVNKPLEKALSVACNALTSFNRPKAKPPFPIVKSWKSMDTRRFNVKIA